MNNRSVLIAVRPEHYDILENKLEDRYSISANQASQEAVLDAIPKFKPNALIVDAELKGTRSIRDFYEVVKANYPDLHFIVYQEELLDILEDYITGIREQSALMEAPKEETIGELLADASAAAESSQEDAGGEGNKGRRIREVFKRILPGTAERSLDEFMTTDDMDDWDLVTQSSFDIHNYHRKLIVVTGASGGIGKTDIALNFSVHAAKCGFKTVLCGFNLQNDDVAGRLGLEYKRGRKLMTAWELYQSNKLTISTLEDCLQEYNGLKVLVGIEKPEERQDMTEEFFQDMVRILKANYDLVICDTENNSYSPAYFSLIEIADYVLVPCTTHNSVLEQLRDELHSWKDDFNIPLSKVDVVFNKAGEGGFVKRDHIERFTTREVIAEIPHSKEMLRGSEREQPAVLRSSMEANRIRKEFNKIIFRYTGKKMKRDETIKPFFTNLKKRVKGLVQNSSRG